MTKVETLNIFVENIPSCWKNEQLARNFEYFGAVESTMVLHKRNGVSKCKGFVNFKHEESATKVLNFFNEIQEDKNECKRRESLDSIDPAVSSSLLSMKVSSATRKEKPKKKFRRGRSGTEPIYRPHRSRTDSATTANGFPTNSTLCPMYAQPPVSQLHLLPAMQPVYCYMPVSFATAPSAVVARPRSHTEPSPYMLPQPQSQQGPYPLYFEQQPSPYWCTYQNPNLNDEN